MSYVFKGRLGGMICSECPEPLSMVKVRLYRLRKDQDATTLAVADAKDTCLILTAEQVSGKAGDLIAEVETDAFGAFAFELGDKQRYGGEPFEIDVYCSAVPRQKPEPKPAPPLQFTITVLQPLWKTTPKGSVAAWDYNLTFRFWCAVRFHFRAWTICGRVLDCSTKSPIAGVRVFAIDADWIQDDPLGSAVTNAAGKFRIDYSLWDFIKTPLSPLINVETFGGPDLYFRIEDPSGEILLEEPRSTGRAAGRENAGNCFCVELCVKKAAVPPIQIPLFTNVGQYKVDPDAGDFDAAGLTSVEKLGFTGTIPLMGAMSDGQSPAYEYRFTLGEYDQAGVLAAPLAPLDATMIAPTIIGKLEYWSWKASLGAWEVKSADYWLNRQGAQVSIPQPTGLPLVVPVNKPVGANGWIEIPRENEFFPGQRGSFLANGNLANLITTRLTAEHYDLQLPPPGLKAGEALPAPARAKIHTFKLAFEAKDQATSAPLAGSNALEKIAICNTSYVYKRHPNWAAEVAQTRAVVSLDLLELAGPAQGAGCAKLGSHLHALYSAYHPLLGSVALSFEGNPPLPVGIQPQVLGGEAVSGAAGYDFDISMLKPCAYVLWLEASLNLSSGWGRIYDYKIADHVAFCKA